MSFIEKLKWDTNFFEINIGRLVIFDEQDFDPIKFNKAVKDNFNLVYVLSYENMLPLSKVVKANLELVDIMLIMSRPFPKIIIQILISKSETS